MKDIQPLRKRCNIALRIALLAVMVVTVVTPVLLPETAPVARADFPERRVSVNNIANGYGWTVYNPYTSGVENPEGPLGSESGCDSGNSAIMENGSYLAFDLGTDYTIDTLEFYTSEGGFITLYTSVDGFTWTDGSTRPYTTGGCVSGGSGSPALWTISGHARYIAFSSDFHTNVDYFAVTLTGYSPTPTPYATSSPIPPQPTQCVTATAIPSATPPRTPTPFSITPQPTKTPTRTPTPGGPTATPGPTATGTPGPSFDTGVATFGSSILPWTAHITSNYLPPRYYVAWSSATGPDGNAGVVFMKDYWSVPLGTDEIISETTNFTGTLVYVRPEGLYFPLRLTGSARWSTAIAQGDTASLSVWYLDPDFFGAGHPAWITVRSQQIHVSSEWSSFAQLITQHGGSGRITAVMVMEEIEENGPSYPDGTGLLLDNLRLYSGAVAVASSYPVCQGTGATGPVAVETKVCRIKLNSIDVFVSCTAPTDALDLGGWISWAWCRVARYFGWLQENTAQLTDLSHRQSINEPIGTFDEFRDVLGDIGSVVAIAWQRGDATTYPPIDWSAIINFRNIDTMFTRPVVTQQRDLNYYLSRCPIGFSKVSEKLKNGVCTAAVTLRELPAYPLIQWSLNAMAFIGVFAYVLNWVQKRS